MLTPEATAHLVRLSGWILPLAIYFFFLGMVNVQRRPFLTTGTRDFFALSFGFSGLLLFGPVGRMFSGSDYIATAIFVVLLVTFIVLIMPREFNSLITYNITLTEFLPALRSALEGLGLRFEERGNSIHLPDHGETFAVSDFTPLRNVTVYRQGQGVDPNLWRSVHQALANQLGTVETRPGITGRCFLLLSAALVSWPLTLMMEQAQLFTRALEWLKSS